MAKFKKTIIKTFMVLLITIPVAAFAHFLVFPQQTRTMLIDYSGFKKEGRLYFNAHTPQHTIDTLKVLIQQASLRSVAFWGRQTSNSKFIYCNSEAEFRRYGSQYAVPATTHVKLGTYVVISNAGIDLDIIAHEMTHAELYQRIGFYNWTFIIPTWFDEGLAMQNDYRNYYSEDTLQLKSNNYTSLPNVKELRTAKQFTSGTTEQVMLNYMAARHEVKSWYSKERMDRLIAAVNAGKSFDAAFAQ